MHKGSRSAMSVLAVIALMTACTPLYAQDDNHDERMRLLREKLERDRLNSAQRDARWEAERKIRDEDQKKREQERLVKNRQKLQEELIKFREAEKLRNIQPDKYLRSLVSLARAYDSVQLHEKGNTLRTEAVNFFVANATKMSDHEASSVFRMLQSSTRSKYQTAGQIKSACEKVFPSAVRIQDDRPRWIDDANDCISALGDVYGRNEQIQFIKRWLPYFEKTGPTQMVTRFKTTLASLYERSGDIDKAGEMYRSKISTQGDSSSISTMTSYALFCLRHDKVREAEQTWREAGKKINWQISKYNARSFDSLLKEYEKNNQIGERNKLIDALLAHPNSDVFKTVDPYLEKDVDSYVASAKFDEAEAIIRKRVKCAGAAESNEPGWYWLLRLSDVCLVNNKVEESNQTFERVLKAAALAGVSTEPIKARRIALLQRLGKSNEAKKIQSSIPARPVASNRAIHLSYALYATSKIDLSGNIRIASYNSDANQGWGRGLNNGNICCPGKLNLEGNLSIDGVVFGNPEPNSKLRATVMPVPNEDLSVPAALSKDPRQLIPLSSAARGDLVGGDYSSSSLKGRISVSRKLDKPIRIFLRDEGASEIANISSANESGKPINFQIWYDGAGRIVLPHNCQFHGIIYAPNAQVQMPSNNHKIYGAIVANTITGEGNFDIKYDECLRGALFNTQ